MNGTSVKDLSLKEYGLSERVKKMREYYFRSLPEICTERSLLITRYCREKGLFGKEKVTALERAQQYRYVLENRSVNVRFRYGYEEKMKRFKLRDSSPFAGSTTAKFKGVPLYPEFMALSIWPELRTISRRKQNPCFISGKDIDVLNHEVFPFWIDDTITERARTLCYKQNEHAGKGRSAPELKLLEQLVFFLASKPNCISHTIPDFTRAVYRGLEQCITDTEQKIAVCSDESSKEFYRALIEVYEGIITYATRCASEARSLAQKETDVSEKEALLEIARTYEQVPKHASRTFREGLTTVWVCWIAVHLENPNVGLSPGRLDQLLWPLYEEDIGKGVLTVEKALELVCYFWLKLGDHVPMIPDAGEQLFGGTGSNQAITVGGINGDGRDAVNDLTYVMIRATELLKLRDPNLNARYYAGVNTREYLRRLCECNVNTGATPAMHNDHAVINALTNCDHTVEQANDYGIVGCVEPGSNGRMYGHSASLLVNLASILELTLFNGRHRHTGLDTLVSLESGNPDSFSTISEFKEAFRCQAAWLLEKGLDLNDILGRVHQNFYPTPVLSSLFEGPLDKGIDLIEGGAVINSSGVTVIGLADVADCFSAVEHLIYNEKTVVWELLLNAIQTDFRNDTTLHTRLTNPEKTPKFGNEDPLAENNVNWIIETLNTLLKKRVNYRGGQYKLGIWTMTNHAGFGRLTGAMPNGRKARQNFASGFTPVSGAAKHLTKALNSVAMQQSKVLPNGYALNLKYMPENRDMIDNFMASVEGFFESGGMEIQFNIIDHNTLIDAVAHPEMYPELLVRVSGYTAYFKDLNPQMQKEIIERTEYLLSGRTAVEYQLTVNSQTDIV